MLTACGGGNDSTPVTPPPPPPVSVSQSLEGSWMTSCQASKNLQSYDEQDTFNFKGNKRTTTKVFYPQDTNCKHSDEVFRARETAKIELGAAVNPGTNTGHTKIDITPTRVIIAPMNSTLTALLNNSGHTSNESIYNGYGITGWRAVYWKNISSIKAAKTNFKINQVIPDILQISKKMIDGTTHKVLKLGAKGGNVDSEGRPLVLARSITATLQKKTTPVQTAQAASLIGQWKYSCRKDKVIDSRVQNLTLDFMGNKLTTLITFYSSINTKTGCNQQPAFQVEIEANIVVGKVINKGATNEHTQIGIKTTKVQIKPMIADALDYLFNVTDIYNSPITNVYLGYGLTDWKIDVWKDLSSIQDAKTNFNIGTQVPDIFKISTATDGSKELKMGDYKGSFDIDGRAMSLEAQGAVFQ